MAAERIKKLRVMVIRSGTNNFVVEYGGRRVFFPRKECSMTDFNRFTGRATLEAPRWKLKAKNLI